MASSTQCIVNVRLTIIIVLWTFVFLYFISCITCLRFRDWCASFRFFFTCNNYQISLKKLFPPKDLYCKAFGTVGELVYTAASIMLL